MTDRWLLDLDVREAMEANTRVLAAVRDGVDDVLTAEQARVAAVHMRRAATAAMQAAAALDARGRRVGRP